MKMISMKIDDIPMPKLSRRRANQYFLESFVESGYRCVEVTDFPHKSARSCRDSLQTSIERMNLYHIKAVRRQGRVFLINSLA